MQRFGNNSHRDPFCIVVVRVYVPYCGAGRYVYIEIVAFKVESITKRNSLIDLVAYAFDCVAPVRKQVFVVPMACLVVVAAVFCLYSVFVEGSVCDIVYSFGGVIVECRGFKFIEFPLLFDVERRAEGEVCRGCLF